MVIEFYYHPQSPPSCLVWMILKELGIEHKENLIDVIKQQQKSEDYKKINPYMQVPALKDGDLILTESRAIAMYLCTKFEKEDKKKKLYPRDPSGAAKFHSAMFRDVDNYTKIMNYMNGEAIMEGRAKGPDEALLPKAKAVLAEYDAILSKQDYMFGKHLTFLDFVCAHTVGAMALTGFDQWEDYPNLKKWKATLSKLPYFEECVKNPIEANKNLWQVFLVKGKETFEPEAKQDAK